MMEYIKSNEIKELVNSGVVSRQLLNPENSESKRVTITEVHLEIGASQLRHIHETSEQIWYAIKGTGKLLLADAQEKEFSVGDVVRFADGDARIIERSYRKEEALDSMNDLKQAMIEKWDRYFIGDVEPPITLSI